VRHRDPLRLQRPGTADGTEARDVPAQVDTAVDRTVLPDALVRALGLSQTGTLSVGGLGGITYTLPTYAVLLAVHDLPLKAVKVVGSPNEPWVLLGRDVLNAHRLMLDGPQSVLEIG
jgi:Aspartyl protease